MSIEAVKSVLGRKPFDPFVVVMSSGDRYEVKHPEFALLVKGGLYVALPPDADDLPERAVYCSALHIAAIEAPAAA